MCQDLMLCRKPSVLKTPVNIITTSATPTFRARKSPTSEGAGTTPQRRPDYSVARFRGCQTFCDPHPEERLSGRVSKDKNSTAAHVAILRDAPQGCSAPRDQASSHALSRAMTRLGDSLRTKSPIGGVK